MLHSPRSLAGFTIIEFLVAMTLSVFLMGATGVVLGRTSESMAQTRARDAANTLGFSVLERSRAYGCGTLVGSPAPNPVPSGPAAPDTLEGVIAENCARVLLGDPEADGAAGDTRFGSRPDGTSCEVGTPGDPQRCYSITISYLWQAVDVSGFAPETDTGAAPATSPARMLVRRVTIEHRSLDYPVELESVQSFAPDFERFTSGVGTARVTGLRPGGASTLPDEVVFTSMGSGPTVSLRVQADRDGAALFPYLGLGDYTYEVFSDQEEPFGELDARPSDRGTLTVTGGTA